MSAAADVAAPHVQTGAGRRGGRLGVAGWIAVGYLILVVVVALAAPVLVRTDPNAADLLHAFAPPSAQHILGTDSTGRDIAARLVYGARTSVLAPAAIVLLALTISIPLALTASWRGGWIAAVINRFTDVVFAIPGLLLAILAASVFGPGLRSAVIALAIAYVPFMARIVMSAADAQMRLPYIEVLIVQAVSPWRLMTVHVLRNCSSIVAGQAGITFAYALIDLAALSFLGLGVQAPNADWGVMVADRDSLLQGQPQQVIVASVAIVLTVLALLVVGSRIADDTGSARNRRKRAA